jgi:hypothetical protein
MPNINPQIVCIGVRSHWRHLEVHQHQAKEGNDDKQSEEDHAENAEQEAIPESRGRDRILDELNRSTLDEVGPVGGDKGEKFLKEPNEMVDLERDAGRKENPDR